MERLGLLHNHNPFSFKPEFGGERHLNSTFSLLLKKRPHIMSTRGGQAKDAGCAPPTPRCKTHGTFSTCIPHQHKRRHSLYRNVTRVLHFSGHCDLYQMPTRAKAVTYTIIIWHLESLITRRHFKALRLWKAGGRGSFLVPHFLPATPSFRNILTANASDPLMLPMTWAQKGREVAGAPKKAYFSPFSSL